MPQDSILEPMLYLLYTVNLPVTLDSTTATWMDDIAILAAHNSHIEVSSRLQKNLHYIQKRFKKWRIGENANGKKSVQVIFTIWKETEESPPVTLNGQRIPQANEAKYLGIHLDRKLEKTYILSANNLDYNWEKCIGYWTKNRNYRLKTNCYCTRQYSKPI